MTPPSRITLESIERMLQTRPRRMQLAREWPDLLHRPRSESEDWSVVLPFCETLVHAFEMMCSVQRSKLREGKGGRWYTFLRSGDEETLTRVRNWHETVGRYVAHRDCLALSFALDYDREQGSPQKRQTRAGDLRARAKPYDGGPTRDPGAADELIEECLSFLKAMTCYGQADAVIAMPPSRPDKAFDLPRHLASGISNALEKEDLSHGVKTSRERPALKEVSVAGKLEAIRDTIKIEGIALEGRTVLLVDDLYQSGVSMNYVAMELQAAGARAVFGLACEKTCRNDDNVSPRD